jgi:hypothetical protein
VCQAEALRMCDLPDFTENSERNSEIRGGVRSQKPKRGRKPAKESRAADIRARLVAWKQTPEPQRVSLRALAAELGTSHQLLAFYLRGLDEWQRKEYRGKAKETRARAEAENRPLTGVEVSYIAHYDHAAFNLLIDGAIGNTLTVIRAQSMHGNLGGQQIKVLKHLASRGYQKAREILDAVANGDADKQRRNNLPAQPANVAKSFGCVEG